MLEVDGHGDVLGVEEHYHGVEGMDRFSDVVEMVGQEYLVLDGLHFGLRGEGNHSVLWLGVDGRH